MFRISLRKFLIAVLSVLIVTIGVLAYLFYILSIPPGKETYRTGELQPIFSIYGKSAKPEDLLKRPNDAAFDGKGNILIADSENGRVLLFDPWGRYLKEIGAKGTRTGELTTPMGVAVADDGSIFVTDKALNKIAIYDSEGYHKRDIPIPHPMKPSASGNRVYVTTAQYIAVYAVDGRELTKIGRKGKAIGEFSYPFGIAADSDGSIYVADLMNLRVQALKGNGESLWVKGTNRVFGLPSGLALDEDYLYVTDSFNHQITILTKQGKVIGNVSRRGDREGEVNYPTGIAARGDGVFAVADKYNDRVQLVRISVKEKVKR